MAANLNIKQNGDAAFFTVKEVAWHKQGLVLDTPPTSKEAIEYAGLDYHVAKTPLVTVCDSNVINVPDNFATIRTDTQQVLGVVGKRYEVVQNKDAFGFFDAIVGEGEAIFETAGALGNGERIFITAKLPDYFEVGGKKDLIAQYLFLTSSHDGSGAITCAFSPQRIVCANTLAMAMSNKSNAFYIRHTTSAQDRLKQAHELMGIVDITKKEMSELFNAMAKKSIVDEELKVAIMQTMATKETLAILDANGEANTKFYNKISSIYDYALNSPTQQTESCKGTVFGFYNAITGYFQNVKEYKSDESKLVSIMEGEACKTSRKALDIATKLILN